GWSRESPPPGVMAGCPDGRTDGLCYPLGVESASHPRADAHVLRTALLIAAATVVIHGALIFNDGVYWDGHIIYTFIQQHDWAGLRSSFGDAGAPARALIHV